MRGLTRYILRQTLSVMVFVAVAFTAAVWLIQALRLIDLIVNRGLSIGLFLYLALLILPRFVDVVLPIAIFIAVLFTYNRLISESELIVMRAAGMSQAGLARPALVSGTVAMVILLALSTYFLPASNRAFKDLQFKIRNQFATVFLQDGTFNTLTDNLTIYVRSHDANGDLSGLVFHDTRDPAKAITVVAERGAFVDTEQGPRLLMVKGSRQTFDRTTAKLSVLSFDQYTLDLTTYRETTGLRDRQPDELFLTELLWARHPGDTRPSDDGRLVEFHLRIINPLTALAFAAIPVACLLTGEFNRRGQAKRVMLAIGFAFLFETFDVGFKNLSGRSNFATLLLYLNVLIPLAVTAWLLWRDSSSKPPIRVLRPVTVS